MKSDNIHSIRLDLATIGQDGLEVEHACAGSVVDVDQDVFFPRLRPVFDAWKLFTVTLLALMMRTRRSCAAAVSGAKTPNANVASNIPEDKKR